MSKIYKYKLDEFNKLNIPADGKILDIGIDEDSNFCYWVLTNGTEKTKSVEILIVFTGEEFSPCTPKKYLKTIKISGLVYHFFEITT